jgi:hypothetical protein
VSRSLFRRVEGEASPRVFWSGVVLGGAVMGWGVYGLLSQADTGPVGIRLARWLGWLVAGLVVHDGVFVPLVLLVGRGLRRVRPVALRTPVQVGLALSLVMTLVAWPLLRGYGRTAQEGNASILPGDYVPAWLTVLAVIWVAAAVLGVVGVRRQRRAAVSRAARRG